MYQTKALQAFINKVNEEAEKAAQAIYDKYQQEFMQHVRNQLHKKDTLYIANGTALISRGGDDLRIIADDFLDVLCVVAYDQSISANFDVPYKTNKAES